MPFDNALIGLSGIMFKSVSTSVVDSVVPTFAAVDWTADISNPSPGFIKLPINKATVIANAVVKR